MIPAPKHQGQPLRQRWTKVLGPAALPLLDNLRTGFVMANGSAARFGPYARNILRNAKAKTSDMELRRSYAVTCLTNLLNPPEEEPEREGPLFDLLKKRIGVKAAAQFFDAFHNVPMFRPRASEEQRQERFDHLISLALTKRNPATYLRRCVANAKAELKRRRD